MGLIKAFTGALTGALASQWLDVISSGQFDELTAVVPGLRQEASVKKRDVDLAAGIITNGSKIYVPENTAMFVFSQDGIEEIVTTPGGYVYSKGSDSVFDGDGLDAVVDDVKARFRFGGQSEQFKRVAFVNLHELRGVKFGTQSPISVHDKSYDLDLEVIAHGRFSIQVVNPRLFVRNFLPANKSFYSFHDVATSGQLTAELLQALSVAVNTLASEYRISELAAKSEMISNYLLAEDGFIEGWEQRFGIRLLSVAVENIQFSTQSRQLVAEFNRKRMSVTAFENTSDAAADTAVRLKMAEGIQEHGLGDGAGMLLGMNASGDLLRSNTSNAAQTNIDDQIETLKKLKGLLDAGILTETEFDISKKKLMNF